MNIDKRFKANQGRQVEIINKKIKLEKDLVSSARAIQIAKRYLIKEKADPQFIKGYIYIEGLTVSDLIIVETVKADSILKIPKVRKCTGKEWNKYYYTFLS